MNKDLEHVACFLEVVRSGSLSKAASKLNIAVSTVSLAITHLEKSLGHQLLLRIKKGVQLTQAGKNLYTLTDQSFQNISEALNRLSSQSDMNDLQPSTITRDSIRIIVTAGLMSLWILPKLQSFIKKYPKMMIKIDAVDGGVVFSENIADVGLLPSVLDNDRVTKKRVVTVHSRIFCSKGYINTYGRPESLEDLKNHRLIGFYMDEKGYRGDVDWHLRLSGGMLPPSMQINSAISQLYAVKLGYGIIAIPEEFPFIDDSFIDLFPDHDSVCIHAYFVTRRDAIVDQAIEDLFFCLKGDRLDIS